MSEHKSELAAHLVVGRKVDGRRVYSKKAKRELVQAALCPGVSVARLAYENGLNANLLRKWITLYGEDIQSSSQSEPDRDFAAAALLPVVQVPAPTINREAGKGALQPETDSQIEIVLAGVAVRVRGKVERDQLNAVLDCLARRG